MNIGEIIQKTREKKNLSINNLSKLANVSVKYIENIEKGFYDPTFGTIERLCKAMNISTLELFDVHEKVVYVEIIKEISIPILDEDNPDFKDIIDKLVTQRNLIKSVIFDTESNMVQFTLENIQKHLSDLTNLKWYQGYLDATEKAIEHLKGNKI